MAHTEGNGRLSRHDGLSDLAEQVDPAGPDWRRAAIRQVAGENDPLPPRRGEGLGAEKNRESGMTSFGSMQEAAAAAGELLKPGSFYWVRPVFDVDFTPPGDDSFDAAYNHWTQQDQPARFDGYDENGNERWFFIGVDSKDPIWPVCWTGKEIERVE